MKTRTTDSLDAAKSASEESRKTGSELGAPPEEPNEFLCCLVARIRALCAFEEPNE
jgi:hypothetical protein